MAIVAGVLLDQVQVDPPQRVVLTGTGFLETAPSCGRTRPSDTCFVAGQVVGRPVDVDLVAALRRARKVVPKELVVRAPVVRMEPRLHSRQVPNKPEQRQRRRWHRPQRQLFWRQSATFHQQGCALVVEAVLERSPLVHRVVRRLGPFRRGPRLLPRGLGVHAKDVGR